MDNENGLGLVSITRALISVSDKTGIVEFASELRRLNVEIISTGGTAHALRRAGIEVRDVSDVTGFPEMMEGRVKTLHPRIHGGLLGVRDNPDHQATMLEHGIEPIDMVVVNLYPFEKTVAREGVTLEEAIEQIDIGGPAMIRSAAKNWKGVVVITSITDYRLVSEEMSSNRGAVTRATRKTLASQAFLCTTRYEANISTYLASLGGTRARHDAPQSTIDICDGLLPGSAEWTINKLADLRYGENPHQAAALYQTASRRGVANAQLLSGKEMSFNNYVDADAAWQLVCDFDELACVIIKHTNPAGVASGTSVEDAYRRALATDPVSAFGGIVAFNRQVDEAAARAVIEVFTEVTIAPGYDAPALEVLRSKKNLRILRCEQTTEDGLEFKQISGGMLVQTRDTHRLRPDGLTIASKRAPSDKEIDDLIFAWAVCKHTKSNAIVYARERQVVGVGAGQMSRVDSVTIGAMRAKLSLSGSVLASDAFFPFRDGIDEAAKHGITAIIQPGGSMRDAEVIAAVDEHALAMVFTGMRHFKH